RGFVRVLVSGVQQTLEDDVAVRDVAVPREIDPAEATVRDASDDFVLAADDLAGLKLRGERVRRPALRAETLGATRLALLRPADRRAARRTEALLFENLGMRQHYRARIGHRSRRNGGDAGAEVLGPAAGNVEAARRAGRAAPGRTDRGAGE